MKSTRTKPMQNYDVQTNAKMYTEIGAQVLTQKVVTMIAKKCNVIYKEKSRKLKVLLNFNILFQYNQPLQGNRTFPQPRNPKIVAVAQPPPSSKT